jgi:hypothetical protein
LPSASCSPQPFHPFAPKTRWRRTGRRGHEGRSVSLPFRVPHPGGAGILADFSSNRHFALPGGEIGVRLGR